MSAEVINFTHARLERLAKALRDIQNEMDIAVSFAIATQNTNGVNAEARRRAEVAICYLQSATILINQLIKSISGRTP